MALIIVLELLATKFPEVYLVEVTFCVLVGIS